MALDYLPLLTLLIGGLAFGLLAIVPIYLTVRAICIWGRRKLVQPRPIWHEWPFLLELVLGGASLATGTPLWFQLQLSIAVPLGLIALTLFGRKLIPALETALIDKISAKWTKRFLTIGIIGFSVIAVLNLWLALRFSEATWLIFRGLWLLA